jgi:hypothetical protein
MKIIRSDGQLTWGPPSPGGELRAIARDEAPAVLEPDGSSVWFCFGRKNHCLQYRNSNEKYSILWPDGTKARSQISNEGTLIRMRECGVSWPRGVVLPAAEDRP